MDSKAQDIPEPGPLVAGGLEIRNAKIAWSFAEDVARVVEGKEPAEISEFPFGRIYALKGGAILVETDEKTRNRLVAEHGEAFEMDGFFAKKLPGGYQIPENAGEFDHGGKHYALFRAHNAYSDAVDAFAWKGAVLDVSSYWSAQGSESLVKTTGDSVKGLLD